ncbi:VTT domain-containing protein [Clostridium disporicum]|uniref:TVP38/TMEM64 family membrane protein n=1 Tax=Clostridium disporicum TaxID=84024 RepID=A0A174J253_9CLOT|nr:VTT domain-containing protein [Clostridium disporicum]MDU6341305.1 VTT domain-containing protein [Clostridium sp.]CUO91275.1 DedA family protein [Clostridium disporicum]
MKKRKIYNVLILSMIILGSIAFCLFNPIDLSIENLKMIIKGSNIAYLIFLGIWIIRLIAFIPGVSLMLLGGLIFSPIEALILSLLGLVLSDTLVFILGKMDLFEGIKNKIKKKYKDIYKLVEEENHKILAIGVLCPVAPTDVICYLSSYLGLGYRRFIITFIIANIPAVSLYSFLGDSFSNSIYNTVFIIITLIVTSIITIKKWNKLKLNIHQN